MKFISYKSLAASIYFKRGTHETDRKSIGTLQIFRCMLPSNLVLIEQCFPQERKKTGKQVSMVVFSAYTSHVKRTVSEVSSQKYLFLVMEDKCSGPWGPPAGCLGIRGGIRVPSSSYSERLVEIPRNR